MIKDPSVVAEIADSHLFKSLDAAGREQLMANATAVQFAAEEVIVREGDPGEVMYLIQDGGVRVSTAREGRPVQLARLGRGACIGEVALLSGRARTATVIADRACTLLAFPKPAIDDVLQAYPKVRMLLERIVSGRARNTIEVLKKQGGGEPE
jgi:CRP-like cAMP-binding protein